MRVRSSTVATIAVAVFLVCSATAAADEFRSKRDAAAAGDPAAVAGSVAQPETVEYEGATIDRDAAADAGLACNEVAGEPMRCYDTPAQADKAMGLRPHAHAAASAAGEAGQPRGVRARTSAHCDPGGPLRVYKLAQQTTDGGRGWVLNLHSRHAWFDLTGGCNNDVSSYGTNEYTAHLSDYFGGGGYWYPGRTRACHGEDYMRTGWDNRVSSRYRE